VRSALSRDGALRPFHFCLFSRVFLLKRQKVLQQQERDSIKRREIVSLFLFFFLFPQSLNGVWLNRERLAPLQGYCIRKGDHIQLGVPLESRETAEYEYEVIEEDWESLAPCLAPKNDQRMEKHKGSRTKRKFSSPGLENLPAEGSSDLRCPLANVASKPIEPEKLHGKGDASSQSLGCLCPGLTSLKASERAAGPHACSALPKVLELSCPKKQKACRPSASQNSLELFKVTMSRMLKLKTQMQEKQIAVLNVKRQTRKGSSKKIVRMEKELRNLQSQLYAEQAQQQARVEQLEKTFQEEAHYLQVPQRQEAGRPGSSCLEFSVTQGLNAKCRRQSEGGAWERLGFQHTGEVRSQAGCPGEQGD
jgi:E3 ubiquitin-protein ligase RNF8